MEALNQGTKVCATTYQHHNQKQAQLDAAPAGEVPPDAKEENTGGLNKGSGFCFHQQFFFIRGAQEVMTLTASK